MAETTKPATPPPAAASQPPQTLWQKTQRWILIVCAVIIGIGGLIKTYKFFSPSLPDCTAEETTAVIRDIFKQKNVELTGLTDLKAMTDTASEKTCQAHFDTPAETGTISYRVSWQGRAAQVLITKVDAAAR